MSEDAITCLVDGLPQAERRVGHQKEIYSDMDRSLFDRPCKRIQCAPKHLCPTDRPARPIRSRLPSPPETAAAPSYGEVPPPLPSSLRLSVLQPSLSKHLRSRSSACTSQPTTTAVGIKRLPPVVFEQHELHSALRRIHLRRVPRRPPALWQARKGPRPPEFRH